MLSETAVSPPRNASAETAPTHEYSAGEAIFWQGDPAGEVFHTVEGVVRVWRVLADGRRAIVGFIYPGDVLGVSVQSRYLFTAEAVTDVKVRRFSRGCFISLVNESPALRPQLLALLCDEMSAAQDQTGFIRSLTSRQKMEEELRQSQTMEAIGQLTAGVAHDFNNLLTVITGNLEMLEGDLNDPRQREPLKEAQDAAQDGAKLTARLLAFGRRQPFNPKNLMSASLSPTLPTFCAEPWASRSSSEPS